MANDERDRDRDDIGTRGAKNELEGSAKELGGKIRGDVGDATDNASEHLKGRAKEMEGKVQKHVGRSEEELSE